MSQENPRPNYAVRIGFFVSALLFVGGIVETINNMGDSPSSSLSPAAAPLPEYTPAPLPTPILTPDNGAGRRWGCAVSQDPAKPNHLVIPGIPPVYGKDQAFLQANTNGGGDPLDPPGGTVFLSSPDYSYYGTAKYDEVNWQYVPNGWIMCAEQKP